jgi:NAD(P)H-nitrite reductase large subunit
MADFKIEKEEGMAAKKHLIIGASIAALSALEEIRRITSEDEVKLVTMEDYPAYCPASLPHLLTGRIAEAELWMKDEDYFKNLGSTLVRGKEVTKVIPEKKEVVYRDGSSENYDTLLVASGAEPVKLPIKGLEEVEVLGYRTLDDHRSLLRKLEGKSDVAILGAGLVGMKLAAELLERGCQVSIIEKEQRVLPLYLDEEAEIYIRDVFTDHKARFFVGKAATEVKKKNGRVEVILSDGSAVDADILINAAGVKSRVSFLEGTEVKVDNGILVDRKMRTGVDDIYAAGDAAEAQCFFTGKQEMNAIIPSAVIQGEVAGANMAGKDVEYEGGISMNIFNYFGNKGFSIGLSVPQGNSHQVLKQKDDKKRRFKKLVFDGDRLVGGMFLNEDIDPGIILYLIERRIDMSPHREALFERTRPLSDPWLKGLKFSPGIG